MKTEGNKSHKTNTCSDVDTSDVECARIEFEDETVPVLHYINKDDIEVKLDQSARSGEKRSKEQSRSKPQHISNQRNENKLRDVSKEDSNRICETASATPTPKVETDARNDNAPTVSDHVHVIQRSEAYIQAYPKEYTENMFLEATLTYVPPVDKVVRDMRIEKRDAEVQTSVSFYKESVHENKTDEEDEINAPAEKEGDVDIEKNGDLEKNTSSEHGTEKSVDENEANNEQEILTHDDPQKVKNTQRTEEEVPGPNHSQLSTNCMASDEMFTACDNCGNIVKNRINDSESEKNWSEYYPEYI